MDHSPIRSLGRNSPEGKQVEADQTVLFDEVEEEFQRQRQEAIQRRQEAIERRRRLQESRARSTDRSRGYRDSPGPAGASMSRVP
jgi:hypothetical protein